MWCNQRMLRLLTYPKTGSIGPTSGLNLIDRIFDVKPNEAIFLRNYIFKGSSLVQRWPFKDLDDNVVTFAAPFRGAHSHKYPSESTSTLLIAEEDGKIRAFEDPPVLKHTFATTGRDIDFTTAYEAVVAVNGTDVPAVGRSGVSWRQFGSPAAVSNLAVAQNAGAGIAAGNYLHIVIPAIEVSGIGQVYANWSNVIRNVVAAPIASFGGTFTYPTDPRVSACYVFRTLVNSSLFYFVSRVTSGAFTDNNADSALPVSTTYTLANPPSQNKSWGVPPLAKHVAFSGNRCVMGALSTRLNAIQTSQIGAVGYELEGFPADGSTLVDMPKDGPVTTIYPIGETGEGAQRANHLFIAQSDACYFMRETDPSLPIQIISSSVGCIGARAIAQWRTWLFFQGRQGVYLWPGSGQSVYLLSEKISPVFLGGGSQNLAGNEGDDNIQYEVYDNSLWITLKSDTALTYPDKAYVLDLLSLERNFEATNPSKAARFSGPVDTKSDATYKLSYGRILRSLENELIILDSSNARVMLYSVGDTGRDTIRGVEGSMPLRRFSGPLLKEDPLSQKNIYRVEALCFTQSNSVMNLFVELGRNYSQVNMAPQDTYMLEWDDIVWDDISWGDADWISSGVVEINSAVGRWFLIDEVKDMEIVEESFSGWILHYTAFKQIGVFK